jgi:hypothetical protein
MKSGSLRGSKEKPIREDAEARRRGEKKKRRASGLRLGMEEKEGAWLLE